MSKPQILMISGGMIAADQILPSLYQLQRRGVIGDVSVCAQRAATVKALAEVEMINRAFPGHGFRPHPDPATAGDAPQPELYKELIAAVVAGQPN